MRRARIVLLSLALAFSAPACGSDDDGGGTGGSSGSGGSAGGGGSAGSSGSGGSAGSAGSGATGGSAGSSGVGGSAGAAGVGGTGGQSAYPPGPYGKEVGDVVANYAFQGYVNDAGDALSNTKPFVASYTMDDLRKSGKTYAFLHVAQFF